MELKGRLRGALRDTAHAFDHALNSFKPIFGASTYPERMFSYYYIQALAIALKPASVLLELPVTGKSKRGRDNHIDALVFNDREVVVAEFKRAWTPSHWNDLARDLARLRGPIAREIHRGFTDGRKRQSFVLLGADCWGRDAAKAWKSGSQVKQWVLPSRLHKADRDYLRVYPRGERTDYDGYYFTWALLSFDEMAA